MDAFDWKAAWDEALVAAAEIAAALGIAALICLLVWPMLPGRTLTSPGHRPLAAILSSL